MQLESAHYLRRGDLVRHAGGRTGTVTESLALWATVRWDDDGREEEVEQLDSMILVTERASQD